MTHITVKQVFRAVVVTLSITTMLVIDNAQAQQNANTNQESNAPSTKEQAKKSARSVEREIREILAKGQPTVAQLVECLEADSSRIGATTDSPSPFALKIIRELRKMPPGKLTRELIPALEKQLMDSLDEEPSPHDVLLTGRLLNIISALGAIGPEANPVLKKALGRNLGIDLFLTRKLGPDASSRVKDLLQNPSENELNWLGYYAATLANPGKDSIPVLLENMKEDEKTYGKYIRMVFDSMGPGCVPQVVATLDDPDWFTRWSAAKTFEMMGPKAKAALPALEKRFKDTDEDLDVRIAAARAMARITGVDETSLYKKIPDLENKLLKMTQDKSLAWRKEYMKREGSKNSSESDGWALTAWLVSAMASGQNLDQANAAIRELLIGRIDDGFGSADGNFIWIFITCHSKSTRHPGRLEAETETKLKKFYFNLLNRMPQTQGKCKIVDSEFLNRASKDFNLMRFNDDLPLDEYIRDYLALSVLKDDPVYRNKKLTGGDTVEKRYTAFNNYFKEALRHWALYGIQYQIGSSAYTYKTYPHYFNLIELSPDPVVRQRAKMFTDVVMMESAQISISGLRGGSKGRAKRGGLADRWDPYQAMLYGERGSAFFLTMPAASNYQAPEPALLLHKIGKTVKTYEIINDRPTGPEPGAERGFRKDCNAINYAWCTPEYITGCGMYNPNGPRNAGAMGRWSGVIFRNLAAISLDAYTGEKWNVQHKDVRITQQCSDGPYVPGDTRVAFEALNDKVSEKDGWIFVNNDEAYAAVRVVTGGYFWLDSIKRLLYANDIYSPIIIQTGRAQDYGSFEKFRAAILKAPLKYDDSKVEYHGPNSAKLEFFPMTPERLKEGKAYILPTINGATVDLNPEYAYSSPYLQNKAGSDIVTLTYNNRQWDYDFNKNTITEITLKN